VEYLRFHREDTQGQRGAAAGGGAEKVHLSKIPDQKSVEAAVKKTSSSSPESGNNMSDPQMRKMATS
jgi:hypothetical protein